MDMTTQKRVYIETSIPSFYYEVREEPEMKAMRNWTRKWWDDCSYQYEMVTSGAVLDELSEGDYASKDRCIKLLDRMPIVQVESAVAEIVEAYVRDQVMPKDPAGDALHLALASFHKCNFLLTWNCNHLANANKFDDIRRANTVLGLYIPSIVTPLELLGGKHNEG